MAKSKYPMPSQKSMSPDNKPFGAEGSDLRRAVDAIAKRVEPKKPYKIVDAFRFPNDPKED